MSRIFEDFFDEIEIDDISQDDTFIDESNIDYDITINFTPGSINGHNHNYIYNIFKYKVQLFLDSNKFIDNVSETIVYKDGSDEKITLSDDNKKKIDDYYWYVQADVKLLNMNSIKRAYGFFLSCVKFKCIPNLKGECILFLSTDISPEEYKNADSQKRREFDHYFKYALFSFDLNKFYNLLEIDSFTPTTSNLIVKNVYQCVKVIYPKTNVFDFCDMFKNIKPYYNVSFMDYDQQKRKIEEITRFTITPDERDLIEATIMFSVSDDICGLGYSFYMSDNTVNFTTHFSDCPYIKETVQNAKKTLDWLFEKPRTMRLYKVNYNDDPKITEFVAVCDEYFNLDNFDTLVWMSSMCMDKSSASEAGRLKALSNISGIDLLKIAN